MKTNIEAFKDQPLEDRYKDMKAYCVCLLVFCLVLVSVIVYERRQVVACRNVARAFVSDRSAALDDMSGSFEEVKRNAKTCNTWPR